MHFFFSDEVTGLICFDRVKDLDAPNTLSDRDDVTAVIRGTRCQYHLVESSLHERAGDDLFPDARWDLVDVLPVLLLKLLQDR